MAVTLVVNPGSSSKKYALYENGERKLDIRFESTDTGFSICTEQANGQQVCQPSAKTDFTASFAKVADQVTSFLKSMQPTQELDAIVVRVVAPGTFFQQHRIVDDTFLQTLRAAKAVAPLHVPVVLHELESIRRVFQGVPVVAASDSAFHHTLPAVAREYSISRSDAERFDIHRFGYHGLSVASVISQLQLRIGLLPERIIVCHVGSGTSVTAVRRGASVETTMGFAPPSGLPMSSRAGDLDASALLQLMRVRSFTLVDAEVYLNSSGGLVGLAGDSDIRQLLTRRATDDVPAVQALDTYAYAIQKAIAASTVALGGLDMVVLTATAAERSPELRQLLLQNIAHLGVQIGAARNESVLSSYGVISSVNSAVQVVVVPTDEMGEMARIATAVRTAQG